jgi:AmpE protein
LVGNFQKGFQYYSKAFFASPMQNDHLLEEGGLCAAEANEEAPISLPYAQILVEHALVVCLVFLAFFTLVAWL